MQALDQGEPRVVRLDVIEPRRRSAGSIASRRSSYDALFGYVFFVVAAGPFSRFLSRELGAMI